MTVNPSKNDNEDYHLKVDFHDGNDPDVIILRVGGDDELEEEGGEAPCDDPEECDNDDDGQGTKHCRLSGTLRDEPNVEVAIVGCPHQTSEPIDVIYLLFLSNRIRELFLVEKYL